MPRSTIPQVNHKFDDDATWLCRVCDMRRLARMASDEACAAASDEACAAGATRRSARGVVRRTEPGWTQGNAAGVNFGAAGGSNISKLVWDRRGKH